MFWSLDIGKFEFTCNLVLVSYVSHLKNLIVGFYTHIANNTSNLLILLQIKKI